MRNLYVCNRKSILGVDESNVDRDILGSTSSILHPAESLPEFMVYQTSPISKFRAPRQPSNEVEFCNQRFMDGSSTMETKQVFFLADVIYQNTSSGCLLEFLDLWAIGMIRRMGPKRDCVVPDFHKRILFSDEAHFWLNGYVNKQNCRIWSEANPQVYV
ncbi:hypothetical protein TNCV_3383301 [Trichonephila clavipes]|nr:hypothetical protein TNCV_3383301 [Trichonephila clavipes]